MTDAERVAKAWADLLGVNYANPAPHRSVDLGRIGSRDGAWMSNSPAAALLAHLEAQP